ncbi:hypothetical protein [Rhizobium phage RHph_X2_24]|nr:hypothetical protein [Rhizobium phage RHph_X2_24]
MSDTNYHPVHSVTGVSKTHARRAMKWLKDRNLLSFYRSADKSLNAFEFKHGKEWTENALRDALKETI